MTAQPPPGLRTIVREPRCGCGRQGAETPLASARCSRGFETTAVDTGDAVITVRHAGAGPPVLLLHGFPQTSAMWHRIAPALAHWRSLLTDLAK